MSKRRHEEELPSSAKERRGGNDRAERLACYLAGLNGQFASWVATNKEASLHKFWIEGVRDYLQHAKKLLDEYKDILPSEGVSSLQQAAADVEDRTSLFSGRPAVAGFGTGGLPASGLFGGPAAQPGSKSDAPATGFMAPPPAATSPASGAPAIFGAVAPRAAAAGGFSFGSATASAPAAGGKDAEAEAPKPLGISAAATATGDSGTGAGSKSSGAAGGTDAVNATSSGTGMFNFGAPTGAPITTGFGVVTSGTAAAAAASGSTDAAAAAAPKAFTFGVSSAGGPGGGAATAPAAAASAPTTTPGFTFGSSASASSASGSGTISLAGSIFGGNSAGTAPPFSFGVSSTTTAGDGGAADASKKDAAAVATGAAASTSAGSFGSFGAPSAGAGSGFSFGSAPAFSFAGGGSFGTGAPTNPPPAEAEEEEPEPEDECAKEPSLKVDDNVDFLFKEKARLQLPIKAADGKIGSWEAKGMGTLSVRRAKTEGAKPYIALFTESGRCLYQAYFNKTMKMVVSDKQKSVAFTAAWSPDGTSPPSLNAALFQFAAGKNRAFEAVILELQKEMTE